MMGVYIKGMEMPRGGEMIVVFSDGTVHKCLPGVREALEKSEAVPVPPHGRLIDADKYLAGIRPPCPEDSQAGCTFETVKMLMVNTINEAPTIIPAEEENYG